MLDGGAPWDSKNQVLLFVSQPAYISPTKEPTADIPMVQSYVDICVNGCLEIEALYRTATGYVQEFINTSTSWNKYWVNNRAVSPTAIHLLPKFKRHRQGSANRRRAEVRAASRSGLIWKLCTEAKRQSHNEDQGRSPSSQYGKLGS